MTIRTRLNVTEGRFYITFTCCKWLPLFAITNGYDIIYKQFDILNSEGHSIVGYVIMPNHVHFIIDIVTPVRDVNKRIGTMKRFAAYELVSRLKDKGREDILQQLALAVHASEKQKGKLHEVFEPSFDIKLCLNDAFTEQKLNYIHNNPCKGKWQLSDAPQTYLHSSAGFYNMGAAGVYKVSHYLGL
jgi:REP element-mobilizing transposase RayT